MRVLSASPGLVVNPDHPAIEVAAEAFGEFSASRRSSCAPAARSRSSAISPTHLGIPTILMGFGLPDDGLHSPNEKYNMENYYMGIMTIAHFFEKYGSRQ